MEPQYLLIQQIQANAAEIEKYLRFVYDPTTSYEQKLMAKRYLYPQARQIKELVDTLFYQFDNIR